jgi:N-acyl-D-aspartate/D-glutamate deacylase
MAEYDLVIRGGLVVDGNGGVPAHADVGIEGGLIREVGCISGSGRREVDAGGAVVAPGFVDLHTHYDGQATWDERMQPSSWHGVTTVVMGNCGVGFAPAAPADRERLVELMEGVEDIPGAAMTEGLTWEWESFADYLDALSMRKFDTDIGAQVPHAAVRVNVMGDRAAAFEVASADEIARMARIASDAVAAGALGFSTSRTLNHKSVSGELTPSYDASVRELVEIARAIGRTGKGVLQLITDYPDLDADFDLMRQMVAASGRPLSVSLVKRTNDEPGYYNQVLNRITAANEEGLPIRAQVAARPVGALLGLQCTLHPFIMNPVWREIADAPLSEQVARMSDPVTKARILAAQTAEVVPNIIGAKIVQRWDIMYELTDPPSYEPSHRQTVKAIADRAGREPLDVAYDMMLRDDGRAMLQCLSGYAGTLDDHYAMLTHPYTLPGLSDGGAHVGTICDGSFPTTLLQHWVRDRAGARLPLEYVVQRQARDTARAVGLTDRGELAPGFRADVNVVDLDRLTLRRPEMHFDLPGGGKRLLQRVDGYRHTFVRGVETYRDGEPTGELPGRLARR